MVTRPLNARFSLAVAVLCLLTFHPATVAAQEGPVDASVLYLGAPGSVCKGTTGIAPSSPSTCHFYINTTDGKLYMRWSTGAWVAAGSVYSVGNGTIGSLFSVSWSTATTTPALNLNFATQSANCLLAGPTSGGAAVPTCRTMVLADVPDALLTDAKINTSGITTRTKLPSALAYEDEANTFTQPQAFSNGIASALIPTLTDTFDFGAFDKLWKQGYLGQLNAVLFALETQTLFGGHSTVGHDAGTLGAAVSSGATTVNFGKTMTPGDFVLIRAQDTGGTYTNEYMTVGSLVSGTTYNVTRNLSGLGAKNWADGLPFLVLGQSGDGRIDMFAYDGRPRTVYTVQGATYNAQTVAAILGNMNGYYGYSSNLFGLCAGDSSAAHICIDPTNGIRIRHNTTNKIVLAPDGSASFTGSVTVTGGNAATTSYADAAEADAIAAAAADATSKAAAAQAAAIATAASDATTKANTAQSTAISTAASDATTKANAAQAAAIAASLDKANYLTPSTTTIDGAKLTTGSVTASKITVTDLMAFGATIGGCAIGSASVVCGSGNDIVSLLTTDATWRLAVGHATPGSAPFRVDKDGNLTAVGGTFTGPLISGADITLGTPDGGFLGSGAYKFLRTGGSADRYGVNAFSLTSTYYQAALENIVDNGADVDVEARTYLRAQGWTSAGSGTAAAAVEIKLHSEIGVSEIRLDAGNSGSESGQVVVDADRFLVERAVHFESEITPTTITGHTNNYNPTGFETTFCLRLSTNGANYQISGLVAPTAANSGRTVCILNVGSSNFLLMHQSGSSTDVNRFRLPNNQNIEVTQNMMLWLRYDTTFQRWVVR